MAGISSKAAGDLENKKGYNGNEFQYKEFSDGSGLELYDFNARTYDQQIGRFIQIDPETDVFQENYTPFHFALNNPVLHSDPDGKNPIIVLRVVRGVIAVAQLSQRLGKPPTNTIAIAARDNTTVVMSGSIGAISLREKAQGQAETASGGTYLQKDKETEKVQRSGRTNDLARREKEHGRATEIKDLKFEVDVRTDDKNVQRGREHQNHEDHKPPLNKIKPISDKNPNKEKYIEAAKQALRAIQETKD